MDIPKEVKSVINKLRKAGFEAYIVGGCVRDFLLARQSENKGGIGIEPEDWDAATNAKPEEIQKVFPKSFYENKFLTVTAQTNSKNPRLKEIEITTYRSESKYTDKRHPDEVKFAKTIQEDLARRDFTVNAIALEIQNPKPRRRTFGSLRGKSKIQNDPEQIAPQFNGAGNSNLKIIDPFGGQRDLEDKIIRAVGNPEERFNEDGLRTLRAVRFAVTLGDGWQIEPKTASAIKKNADLLKAISKERIRDEFMKIVMSEKADDGVELLRQAGLLSHIIPELEENYKVPQNKHHIYDCYQHALYSLKYAVQKKYNKYVRLAALFHDIGKPRAKKGEGQDATFYNHEVISAKITEQILFRLKFSKSDIEKIVKLVRHHLFYYNVGEVSDSSVRRLIRETGTENIDELLQVRHCDRIGSGVPKAEPYKLRHLRYVIDKVSRDPLSVKMLKVDGYDVMRILAEEGVGHKEDMGRTWVGHGKDMGRTWEGHKKDRGRTWVGHAGPRIGHILHILLSYIISCPEKNAKKLLEKEVEKLKKLPNEKLEELARKAKNDLEELKVKKDEMTKKKYWVT